MVPSVEAVVGIATMDSVYLSITLDDWSVCCWVYCREDVSAQGPGLALSIGAEVRVNLNRAKVDMVIFGQSPLISRPCSSQSLM
jgi:hypothetical protein